MRHEVGERTLMHGEAYVLSLVTAYVRPGRIFEIGTGTGQAALLMARQAPGARIDTLDLGEHAKPSLAPQRNEPPLRDHDTVGRAYRGTDHEQAITQHVGDSATFDFSPWRGQIDLVFVDGAHTYDYVKSDSEAALSLLSPGGVIVWDDCAFVCPGVAKALLELRHRGKEIYRVLGTQLAVMKQAGDGMQ
jgi:predicted O-methyltransferase YrrM